MHGRGIMSECVLSDKVQQPCRESNDRVIDYYDTETTVNIQSTTSEKPQVYVNTKIAVGFHKPEKESSKPRERKSNHGLRTLPHLLSTALTVAFTSLLIRR